MMLLLLLLLLLCLFYTGAVALLLGTEASLFLPSTTAARDRWSFVWQGSSQQQKQQRQGQGQLRLRLRVLAHLLWTYSVTAPVAAWLWLTDEILFSGYHLSGSNAVLLEDAVIILSVPRAGTTSFHRALALDKQRFVTPCMLDLYFPFCCIQTILKLLARNFPQTLHTVEQFLKRCHNITEEVDARHPVQLLGADADDILLGEWHWVSTGSVRTFPVPEYYLKHYRLCGTEARSLLLHQRFCQKLVHCDGGRRHLLLRSHLSPCSWQFQQLYPRAQFVGIARNPRDVWPSFVGLVHAVLRAAAGVDILQQDNNNSGSWATALSAILADQMQREAALYQNSSSRGSGGTTAITTGTVVAFDYFQRDLLECIAALYAKLNFTVSREFRAALEAQCQEHQHYKTVHHYKNPSFEDLGVDPQLWMGMEGVQQYAKLQEIALNDNSKKQAPS